MSTVPSVAKLSEALAGGRGLVLDGALATYLEVLGADISSALWSADLLVKNPSLIQQAHADYFAAGAHIALTASYQASLLGLTTHLDISAPEAIALIQKSVSLAHAARSAHYHAHPDLEKTPLFVAGSVGPYGAYLADGSEYTGVYSHTVPVSSLTSFHRPRIAALLDANVDFLACETLPSFPEAKALASLLAEEFPSAEAWFSFTVVRNSTSSNSTTGGERKSQITLPDSTPLPALLSLLNSYPQIVAMGVNCVSAELALDALQEMRGLTSKPLVVYANSGEAWDAEGRCWTGERSGEHEMERLAEAFWERGAARVIGGCCRTVPKDIEVVAGVVGSRNKETRK